MSLTRLPYHRTRAGKLAPCGARTRPCPLAEHFSQLQYDDLRLVEEAAAREAKAAAKTAKLAQQPQYTLRAPGQKKVARVAPAGKSAFRCPRCDRHMVRGFGDSGLTLRGFRCPSCSFEAGIEQWEIDIQADNVKYLDDEVAAKAKWYHVTEDPNWGEKMAAYAAGDPQAPAVHVGTKATSLRHAELRKFHASKGKYLFEIKLTEGTSFSPHLQEDVDYGWPSTVGDFTTEDFPHVPTFEEQGFAPDGATRYLNRFEGAGTISLLLAPHLFAAKRID
jgi:hypothetical protein